MNFFESLWSYILISSPYLLFGCAIAGVIHSFISLDKIHKWLGQNSFLDSLKAALIGVPLPLCSCSVIPMAATLKKNGASNAATSSFLIATPESGVDSIAMTYAVMDLPMTIFRVVAAFLSAIFAGVLNQFFNDFQFQDDKEDEKKCCKVDETKKVSVKNKLLSALKYGFVDIINDISVWLAVGLIMGAAINSFVPENMFANIDPAMSKFLILLVGIPLYICASATTPIAASLVLKGMSPGSALILLLVGPATNISNILVMQKYIGKKGIIINIFSIVVVSLLFATVTDYFYSTYFENVQFNFSSHEHMSSTKWYEILLAVLFTILLIKGLYEEKISRYFKK